MTEADDAVEQPDGAIGAQGDGRDAGARPRASMRVVATGARWAAGSATLTLLLVAAAEGALLVAHSSRSLSTLAAPLSMSMLVGSLLIYWGLRAEELRLARALRTARTGTPALRALVVRQRVTVPLVTRFVSTKLGTAAVLLADGDREGAIDALGQSAVLARGGRLEALRSIVNADLRRSSGTPDGLSACVRDLRRLGAVGNREVDLYRIHVLVKAILAQGDGETGFEVARQLSATLDDETRTYVTWLRVWLDLDRDENGVADPNWPDLSDGDLRMASLVARVQGADSLVTKLGDRLSAIARSRPRG